MEIFTATYALCVFALLVVYWRIPHARAQNALLCAASALLCASIDPRFALLLVGTSLLEYGIQLRLARADGARKREAWMWGAVLLDVGSIAAFKYLDTLAQTVFALSYRLGLPLEPTTARVIVPLGLSFYTLQRLSHTLDVYYRTSEPCTKLTDYLAFVSFFPLLHTGPIERGRNLLPQLATERRFSWDDIERGSWLIGLGAFKKAFVGGHCATLARHLSPASVNSASTLGTLLGVYAYAFQLYAEFSGYSDIARGTAQLFGFRIIDNFRAPYWSKNVSELWQRWHVSLSSFLDVYVYRPSAMAFRGLGTTGIVLATYVTFLASALWHGRGSTFLVWGAIHATALAIFTTSKKLRKRLTRTMPPRFLRAASVALTFHVVCLGYVFFRARDLNDAMRTLGPKFAHAPHLITGAIPGRFAALLALVGLLSLFDWMAMRTNNDVWLFDRPLWQRSACYAAMAACVLKFYAPASPFVYLQF